MFQIVILDREYYINEREQAIFNHFEFLKTKISTVRQTKITCQIMPQLCMSHPELQTKRTHLHTVQILRRPPQPQHSASTHISHQTIRLT
jgi:hypothetical protein